MTGVQTCALPICGFGAFYSGLPVLLDPVVTLEGESVIHHRAGRVFVDPGAKATDRKDGDLSITTTGLVDVDTLGTYTLTYDATDSEGNAARPLTRTVHVVDPILPLIFLNGTPSMVQEVGTQFIDPGATALDQNDQSITVDVEGSVDVFNTGVYTLTYSAQDDQGNAAEALTRQVWVVDENYKYLSYFIDGDEVLITDCDTAAAGELMIPAFIEGLPVVAIGANAFADCTNLTGIQLPDSIREISEGSFKNCSNLLEVELPEGLTQIPKNVFHNCQSLESINIPEGVKEIGAYAFGACSNLVSMIIQIGRASCRERV